jgi:hypothetical protein
MLVRRSRMMRGHDRAARRHAGLPKSEWRQEELLNGPLLVRRGAIAALLAACAPALVVHAEDETLSTLDGGAPAFLSRSSFYVRQTSGRVLRAGEASTLAPGRDNIHTFTAERAGARFVDITIAHGPDAGFSYLNIEGQEALGGRRLAHWAAPS